MGDRALYSRVYWGVIDDPKFENIYGNHAHLATWLRLLIIADQAHPQSAHLPSADTAPKASVAALVKAGLVDLVGTGRFRVHGLDAERARRREAHTRPRRTNGESP